MNNETLKKILITEELDQNKKEELNEKIKELSKEELDSLQQSFITYILNLTKKSTPFQKGKVVTTSTPFSTILAKNLLDINSQAIALGEINELATLYNAAILAATEAEIQQIELINLYNPAHSITTLEGIEIAESKIKLTMQKETITYLEAYNQSTKTIKKAQSDYQKNKITSQEYHHILETEEARGQYLTSNQNLQELLSQKQETLLQYGKLHTISSRSPVMPESEQDKINTAITYYQSTTTIYQAKLQMLEGTISEEEATKKMGEALDQIISLNIGQNIFEEPKINQKG